MDLVACCNNDSLLFIPADTHIDSITYRRLQQSFTPFSINIFESTRSQARTCSFYPKLGSTSSLADAFSHSMLWKISLERLSAWPSLTVLFGISLLLPRCIPILLQVRKPNAQAARKYVCISCWGGTSLPVAYHRIKDHGDSVAIKIAY
jgi:hypothetical protein